MPVPPRFPQNQRVPKLFKGRQIALFVGGVLDDQINVDNGLGGQPGHRSGPDMLHVQHEPAIVVMAR